MIKFPAEYGVGEVRGDQVAARELYSNAGDGQPLPDHDHRKITDGCRTR